MADFLTEKRDEIETRLKELQPLVTEYERLERAAAALAGIGNGTTPKQRGTRRTKAAAKSRKPTTKGRKPAASTRRGRPRGSGERANQALALVKDKPGITIAEIADKLGIKANYLYRVMPTLESDGKVTKRDNGYHPAYAAIRSSRSGKRRL